MNTATIAATDTRPKSVPDGIFRITPGSRVREILNAAEAWGPSVVIFWPGEYEIRDTFEFKNILGIYGFGIGVTRIKRFGQKLFHSVWTYATMDHPVVIGGFEIENMVETAEPAIELGSQQNASVGPIYSWGKPADLLCLTNAQATNSPPYGCWTEDFTMRFPIVIYGPKSAAIRLRNTHPQKHSQSFSRFHGAAQITLTEPGSIGVDFDSHCHAYGGEMDLKINIDDKAQGDAVGVNVGPECNITGMDWKASFIEGVPLYGDAPEGQVRPVIRPAGLRIRVASSARVSGHGKFYRQRESHTPDEIVPGVNWEGKESGFVRGGILEDEGI